MKIIKDLRSNKSYPYNRKDDKPIVGLDENLIVLDVIEEERPALQQGESLTRAEPVDDLERRTRTIGWIVQPATPSIEYPDVKGFYKALIGSNLYMNKLAPLLFSPEPSWCGEPFNVVTAAATNLFIGVTEAPSPREPEPSLQSSLWGFVAVGFAVGGLDQKDVEEVNNLMTIYGLQNVYTLFPPAP